jgi:hypothetical protein
MAATATFALKAGLCVRRIRFAIVSPDLRHLRRSQAETPLIDLSEFSRPPLYRECRWSNSTSWDRSKTCDNATNPQILNDTCSSLLTTASSSNANLHLPKIIDAAVAGDPQFVQHRDSKEVVVMSREHYEKTKPNLKTFLLGEGYSGEGEEAFDEILRDIRAHGPDVLAPRNEDIET